MCRSGKYTEWFPVQMDMREINTRMSGRDLSLLNGDDRKWNLRQLLFADETALVTNSEEVSAGRRAWTSL